MENLRDWQKRFIFASKKTIGKVFPLQLYELQSRFLVLQKCQKTIDPMKVWLPSSYSMILEYGQWQLAKDQRQRHCLQYFVFLPSCLCSLHFKLTFPYKGIFHSGTSKASNNCLMLYCKNKYSYCWPKLKRATTFSVSSGNETTLNWILFKGFPQVFHGWKYELCKDINHFKGFYELLI